VEFIQQFSLWFRISFCVMFRRLHANPTDLYVSQISTHHKSTSNVTKSRTTEAQALVCLPVCGAHWWVLSQHSIMLRIFFIVKCGIMRFLCAMCVLVSSAIIPIL